jgi:hypothetical protein
MFVEILLLTEAQIHVPFVGVNSYLLFSNFSQHCDNFSPPLLLVCLLSVKSKRAAYTAGRVLVVEPRHASNKKAVRGIRDILMRMQIPGSVPLTNGSGSGSNSGFDSFLH